MPRRRRPAPTEMRFNAPAMTMSPPPAERERGRALFLDLENLAFLAYSLQPLALLCRARAVEFRSYTCAHHDHADRATHLVDSVKKEAVDVAMVWDAARLAGTRAWSARHAASRVAARDSSKQAKSASSPATSSPTRWRRWCRRTWSTVPGPVRCRRSGRSSLGR